MACISFCIEEVRTAHIIHATNPEIESQENSAARAQGDNRPTAGSGLGLLEAEGLAGSPEVIR